MNTRNRLIHIHSCRGATWNSIKRFFQIDPSLQEIYSLSIQELEKRCEMTATQATDFYQDLHSKDSYQILTNYDNWQVKVTTFFDEDYPVLLKEIYDPPWVLYYKGVISLTHLPTIISVVGTRDPSQNGLLSLEKIVAPLIEKNWVIASGLAIGIDARAHTFTMNRKGKTIAVLGSGFDHIYPKCHQRLAELIMQEHLLISEYPPHVKPQKWHFPIRNRIVSGISKGTIVIEAKRKSGTLITADLALQQGREVFAVPGSILDDRCEGTHWLIQQGAKLTKSAEDVLNEW